MPISAADLFSPNPTNRHVLLGNPNFTETYPSSPNYADSTDTVFHIISKIASLDRRGLVDPARLSSIAAPRQPSVSRCARPTTRLSALTPALQGDGGVAGLPGLDLGFETMM
ncbi:hypothetical protein VE02_04283 [Pseudogymnoascus sp. 03VT05]|nr:hypothetical protein VE02_04283 [Pseudogymnoascus sp. 03VT05]